MAESEDSRAFTGDDTDDTIGYGGSSTHGHADEGTRDRNDENLRQGQGIPGQQPTQSQTDYQDGSRQGIQEETPTPTPEPTESNSNVIPVVTSTFGPGDNTTPTPSSSVETDSTAGISNTGNGGSTGMSGNKKVAIAVPVAIGGAAVIAGIILLVLYLQRRKQRKQQQGRASLLPPANTRLDMGQAPAAATMVLPSSQAQAQAQAQPRNIDLSPPFDGSLPHDPSPPYQPSTNTGSSQHIDANHAAAIGVALTPEQQAPPSPSPSPSPPPAVTGVAARNIHSQDIDSQNRAQSPFDDPIPDTFSDISRVSGRRRDGMGSIRSAVSSIDDEHEGRDHGRGHGRGRMSID